MKPNRSNNLYCQTFGNLSSGILTINRFSIGLAWVLALLVGFSGSAVAAKTVSIIPAPLQVQYTDQAFVLPPTIVIEHNGSEALKADAAWIADLIAANSDRKVLVSTDSAKPATLRLELVEESDLALQFEQAGLTSLTGLSEAYSLNVLADGIVVQAAADAGLYYGLTSVWQLLSDQALQQNSIPTLRILDAPEFKWRGLMLDSARHMQSVEFIKQYIDWMSLHKMNVFHWHMTDDQAWRLEIKAYPKLTQIGGFRVPAGAAPAADIDPETGNPRLYGGFYTQEQVKDIVAHAAKRQITVVPEIDVPGHGSAAIAAYPELGVAGFEVDQVPASWGIYDNVFNLEESTFEFLETVLSEVVELFPGSYIHLGGDEVVTKQWQASARIGQRMEELNIESIQSLQNYYVERLNAYLQPLNRRVIGWDEILESQLPADAAVMSWRGVEGAKEAVAKGHEAVLSPAPTLYLDHIQTEASDGLPGRAGVITVQDIYNFVPVPEPLGDRRPLLLGVQGNVWTEHIRMQKNVELRTWPRAAAIAELGWSTPDHKDWDNFNSRLHVHQSRLAELGINFYRETGPKAALSGSKREDNQLDLCSNAIVLALDDDSPISGLRDSFLVDIQNPCWIWRDADLSNVKSFSAAVGQLPFNFEIGDSINSVVVNPPQTPEGELTLRLGACDGPLLAALPLAPAVENQAVTELPAGALNLPSGAAMKSDLCISFNRNGIDPIWVIDWVRLDRD